MRDCVYWSDEDEPKAAHINRSNASVQPGAGLGDLAGLQQAPEQEVVRGIAAVEIPGRCIEYRVESAAT